MQEISLKHLIQNEILQSDGHISFSRFMDLALYTPELGYYASSKQKFGPSGDFVTAPEISPLFAQCLAKPCQQLSQVLGAHDILEIGAGRGSFAKDLLLELERLNCLPQHYYIHDISPELCAQQRNTLASSCPHLLSRVTWLPTLPSEFTGIIFANEVLDALPFDCFKLTEDGIKERSVIVKEDGFSWSDITPTLEFSERIRLLLNDFELESDYESEINFRIPTFIHTLSTSLKQGVILLLDYGYGRREYYHPERKFGTMKCFYQHSHHENPFIHVGSQDMTAHVEFTTVVESAVASGLSLLGFTTQGSFLLDCGLIQLASANSLHPIDQYKISQAIKTLTLPSQMGELVKVMGLSKGIDLPLIGFGLHDRRRDL